MTLSCAGASPASTDQLWIGLNDQRSQMFFEWSDRSQVAFTRWQSDEPSHANNLQEDCVLIRGKVTTLGGGGGHHFPNWPWRIQLACQSQALEVQGWRNVGREEAERELLLKLSGTRSCRLLDIWDQTQNLWTGSHPDILASLYTILPSCLSLPLRLSLTISSLPPASGG